MSDNTILGGPPSGTERPPDESSDGDQAADSVVIDAPGTAATAVHRNRLYTLLGLAFDRPDDDLETALADGAVGEHLLASATAIDDDVAEAARAVVDTLPESDADANAAAESLTDLRHRWASLFGVEEGVTVSPYELTYLPGPLMTNVRRLADINGFYEAFDLEIADDHNDRGDHICFLLEFLGHLSLREASLRERGDRDGVRIVVDARAALLEDHLGRWYWRFADEVSQHDDGFYASAADLLAALVETELETLDLDPEWVPDAPEVTEWNEDVFGDSGRGCGGCGVDTAVPGEDGSRPLESSDWDGRS
ncbi:TorD/DmsD family molecular chaperone [Halobiforma nitratireducens]|uniref:Anaerobic dehydrogenase subunit n=1 Tax=Halobiforma nitratireducens JCM 10879 TaxID=1227454 RepID=M0MNF3_9EURY|nr:molecular chaperone TorD family protein [Halobiforma nitratireducens]EMA45965.1 anaerobic dehydrogenase subunit [Halobiforma nitratireducens JCM 10879]